MNTHVKITQSEPADLSRRSFLVGTAAAGLALGYSGVPGLLGADQAFAATGNFDYHFIGGGRTDIEFDRDKGLACPCHHPTNRLGAHRTILPFGY